MRSRLSGLARWMAGTETGRLAGLVTASLIFTLLLVSDGGLARLVLVRSHFGVGYYQITGGYTYYDATGASLYGVTYGSYFGVLPTHTPTTVPATSVPEPGPPAPTATPAPAATTAPAATATTAPATAVPPAATPVGIPTAVPLPPSGIVTLVLPGGAVVNVAIDAAVIADLPANRRISVVFNPNPALPNEVVAGLSLGGGNVVRVAPPVDIQITAQDATTGAPATLPDTILRRRVRVKLPIVVVPPPQADAQFQWLREVQEDGKFAGYLRGAPSFDPGTNSQDYEVEIGELGGTLFLPVFVIPAWVQNHDPLVHIWSGPTLLAVDFGEAAPQFTTFTVVGPQVASRVFVHNPATDNYGWIDVEGIGPSGPPRP